MADLLEGRESGEKEGYISIEDLRELLKSKTDYVSEFTKEL